MKVALFRSSDCSNSVRERRKVEFALFLCTLIIKHASCDIFMLRKGRFLAVLFAFLVMNEYLCRVI